MPATRKRRPPVARHFKIDALLPPDARAEYHALLRDPQTTTDAAHAWLTARGVACSRSAVARHRRHFLATAQQRESHALAVRELLDAGRLGGTTLADALLGASQAVLVLRLAEAVEQAGRAPLPAADLAALVQAVQRSLATRRQHDAAARQATAPHRRRRRRHLRPGGRRRAGRRARPDLPRPVQHLRGRRHRGRRRRTVACRTPAARRAEGRYDLRRLPDPPAAQGRAAVARLGRLLQPAPRHRLLFFGLRLAGYGLFEFVTLARLEETGGSHRMHIWIWVLFKIAGSRPS